MAINEESSSVRLPNEATSGQPNAAGDKAFPANLRNRTAAKVSQVRPSTEDDNLTPKHAQSGENAPPNVGLTSKALRCIREKIALAPEDKDDSLAEELSAVLALAERIYLRRCLTEDAEERLNYIVDCLLTRASTKQVIARDCRLRMQVEVYHRSGYIARTLAYISSGSPVALTLTALIVSWAIWMIVFILAVNPSVIGFLQLHNVFFMDLQAISVISYAALAGGIVSIGTRIKEFSRVRDLDPFAVFWTAMLKPLLAVILAGVILAALSSGMISINVAGLAPEQLRRAPEDANIDYQILSLLWLVGFITGFSERFAWDFVDRAQGSFGVGSPTRPPNTAGRGGASTL